MLVFITVVLFLTVFGFNKISYSANDVTLNDEIYVDYEWDDYEEPVIITCSGEDSPNLDVILYSANNAIPVFLFDIDYTKEVPRSVYINKNQVNDLGLLYILNKSAVYNGTGIIDKNDFSTESFRYYEAFATQLAIFSYMRRKGLSTNELLDESNLKKYDTFYGHGYSGGINSKVPLINVKFYDKYIKSIVNKAEDVGNAKDFKISFEKNDSITDKGDYYQTSSINVSYDNFDDLKGYTVSIDGIDGAKVVDKDGKELKGELSNKSFYINIPKGKISTKAVNLTITASATFDNYVEGYEYVDKFSPDRYSNIFVGKTSTKTISSGDSIEISSSADTGLYQNKIIYYIGTLFLLLGFLIVFITLFLYKKRLNHN